MFCPKCGSDDVNVQVVNETKLVKQHHGFIWWSLLGWWWIPIKWLVFTIPTLILTLLKRNRKVVNVSKTMCICQICGHTWESK